MRHIISLRKDAKKWDGGLPVGNGRLGASVLGKIREESIVINEESIWYGSDHNRKNPDAKESIAKIRQLVQEGRLEEAHFYARMEMTSAPKYLNPYQYAAELKVHFLGHGGKNIENRACYLDLDRALAHVQYTRQGKTYHRTHFVSHKYNVFVMHVTSDAAKDLTVQANLMRKPFEEETGSRSDGVAYIKGQCGPGGVRYYCALKLAAEGAGSKTAGDYAYTEQADAVTIYVAAGTDFSGGEDFEAACNARLEAAAQAGYETILETHMAEYQALNERTTLDINDCAYDGRITQDQLNELRENPEADNDYLVNLLFAFAKYLMISASYDCLLPANLQGIWNGEFAPPWQSEYTININCQMNYWMAEKCGLPECHMPLFDLIERLVVKGKESAEKLYGCRGFVAHHNTGLWANTDPEGVMDASPFWVMGGAWLSLHMYEHYLFTQDRTFLKERAVPVMREALRFFEDYLTENEDGQLVTGPCVSPENTYYSQLGQTGSLAMGPVMDIQILRQLCKAYLDAAEVTGTADGVEEVSAILKRLPPTKIGSDGRILEWQKEYQETALGHRHISHLYGLHPGNEITKETPELLAAAEKTLTTRLENGGGHTGWSRAWVACFYARLGKGNQVYENIMQLLRRSIMDNLYDTHPPFQIDGNFGIANAILEALIQSHAGYIDVLPALPDKWQSGHLHGVRLRGNLRADLDWKEGKLASLVLTAEKDCTADVVYGTEKQRVTLQANQPVSVFS